MSGELGVMVLSLLVYRLAVLAVGALSIYLGYRLFRAGVFDMSATEIKMRYGEGRGMFKSGAPGSVLGFFGAAVVCVAIVFPPEIKFSGAEPQVAGRPAVPNATPETPPLRETATTELTQRPPDQLAKNEQLKTQEPGQAAPAEAEKPAGAKAEEKPVTATPSAGGGGGGRSLSDFRGNGSLKFAK